MRVPLFLALTVISLPALAQVRAARPAAHAPARPPAAVNAPKSIGKFDDWQAATHQEAGQLVCYAFTRASASAPPMPGRGDVVLTVTQRPGGRDAVAISAGYAYAQGAEIQVQVDQTPLPFYSAQRSAFARDGHAAVLAFEKGRSVVAKSPAPRVTQVQDSFSLHGFSPAYAAINKACPPK